MRVNEEIRVREVRLIDKDGEPAGIVPTQEALQRAYDADLDLVEVAPQARPPVCRVMDYGKYKYETSRRDREARRRQKTIEVKELRMGARIDGHDFEVKVRNARRFLEAGDRVKVSVRFRGREIVHSNLARQKLQELAAEVSEVGVVERHPGMEGRQLIMVLVPK